MTTRANGEADIADPASMRPAFGTPDDFMSKQDEDVKALLQ